MAGDQTIATPWARGSLLDLLRKYLRDEIFRFRASRMRNVCSQSRFTKTREAYWLKYADDWRIRRSQNMEIAV